MLAALLIDQLFGEPTNALHPVVWIGRCVAALKERGLALVRENQFRFGLAIALLLPIIFALATRIVADLFAPLPVIQLAFAALLLKSTFALRALGEAGNRLHGYLTFGHLPEARDALSWLCSRDASQLSATELAAAGIESVAENASDSVVAPLFYFALFGLPGAVFYRVVNTMDAMLGYHGELEYLGKASARLDDILNWIPARITAALLFLAAYQRKIVLAKAVEIYRRDAGKTESPNAGQPMAAMAGILGVQLSKAGAYTLGDADRDLEADDIQRAWALVQLACFYAFALAVIGSLL